MPDDYIAFCSSYFYRPDSVGPMSFTCRCCFGAAQVHKLARVTGFSVYWRVDDKERWVALVFFLFFRPCYSDVGVVVVVVVLLLLLMLLLMLLPAMRV